MTEEAIREGFQKLKDGSSFDNLYAAGSARAIGDWLLGINATRLYTLKYGQLGQVLSIGRVQTPTLALIVERQKSIDNFVPESYWELKTKYKDVLFSAVSGRFMVKDEGVTFLAQINEHPFVITDFSRKKGIESPPSLFDLTSLQVECNKKYGFSADDTLKTIQSLYEKKLTTYPRVDTTYLSDDIYPKIPGILKGLKVYESIIAPILTGKIRKSKKVFDDKKVTDHHAIIPTGINPVAMSQNEKQVYELVALRFIANFYPDSTISNTQVLGEVKNVKFKATGKQILTPGWRTVFSQNEDDTKKSEDLMPEFTNGETGPHEPQLLEKETQPPKPHTEATLLRAMETAGKQVDDDELREIMKENGIGRPSTRAAIIETLFRRKYITKLRKNLNPTVTGVQLIDAIKNDLLKSAELTGLWEKKLREIEKGQYDAKTFMDEMKQMVSDLVFEVKHDRNITKIEVVEETVPETKEKVQKEKMPSTPSELLCPKCKKGTMLKGNSAWGCSLYNEGCKTLIPFEFLGKKLSDKNIEQLIQKGQTSSIKGLELDNNKVDGKVIFTDTFELSLLQDEVVKWVCPSCKMGEIVKGSAAYGCNNYKNGCRVRIPFEYCGKKLSEKQIEALVVKGKTPVIKGFIHPQTQASFDANLGFDEGFNLITIQ